MQEHQWSEVKALLLYWIGKFNDMLVPPPNKFLIPVSLLPHPNSCNEEKLIKCIGDHQVLEAICKLLRKKLFVGGEVDSISSTAIAILTSTKGLLVCLQI